MRARKFAIATLLVLLLGVLVKAEINGKHRWGGFRVGSWAELQTVANDGHGSPTFTRWTLVELKPDAAVVHVQIRRNGAVLAEQDVPFPIPERGKNTADRNTNDTFLFKGRQLSCIRREYDSKKVTLWECPEVPGFMAKTMSATQTTTLVDYEAK
jgi:hypothetical protein